jgi:hypothetical protein
VHLTGDMARDPAFLEVGDHVGEARDDEPDDADLDESGQASGFPVDSLYREHALVIQLHVGGVNYSANRDLL